MNPDPGGPKTYGSYGSVSGRPKKIWMATLPTRIRNTGLKKYSIKKRQAVGSVPGLGGAAETAGGLLEAVAVAVRLRVRGPARDLVVRQVQVLHRHRIPIRKCTDNQCFNRVSFFSSISIIINTTIFISQRWKQFLHEENKTAHPIEGIKAKVCLSLSSSQHFAIYEDASWLSKGRNFTNREDDSLLSRKRHLFTITTTFCYP
jgi:hypothetical protein